MDYQLYVNATLVSRDPVERELQVVLCSLSGNHLFEVVKTGPQFKFSGPSRK